MNVRQVSGPAHRARQVWGWALFAAVAAILFMDETAEPSSVAAILGFVVVQVLALQAATRAVETRVRLRAGGSIALALGVTFTLWLIAGVVLAQVLPHEEISPAELVTSSLLQSFFFVGLWMVGFRYPQLHARLLEAEALQRQAELLELRSRLQPHFLGNSLNAIAALVTAEPRRARQLLADLGELLRELASTTAAQRTVRDELTWVRRYTSLLEARHAGDLEVRWDVSPEVEDALVPSFVVQPLVENAVLHGTADTSAALHIVEVTARHDGAALVLRIENPATNPAPPPAPSASPATAPPQEGTGLTLVRARLRLWHPGAVTDQPHRDDVGRWACSYVPEPLSRPRLSPGCA